MLIKKGDRISRLEIVDGRIEKTRIPDDIGNEFLYITIIGDVAAPFTGDIHLASDFAI